MPIIDTLTKSAFIGRMRAIRPENFSYNGCEALYEYLELLSEDTDTPIEFDPIGLCCEYSEYANFKDVQADYPDLEDVEDLESRTTVIYVDGNPDGAIIIQQY